MSVKVSLALILAAVMLLGLTARCQKANQPPQISTLTASPDTVALNGASTLRVAATDADGDSVSFVWEAAAGSLSSPSGDSVVWTAPGTEGVYAVCVVASDGNAADASNIVIAVGSVPKYMVSGYAHYTETWWGGLITGHYISLVSDPLIASATVTAGGHQLAPYPNPNLHARSFYDTIRPTPGTEQTMSVQSELGNCAAACSIPGGFAFVTPTNDSIDVGTTLVMSWTTASNAGWYQVYVEYWMYDTMFMEKDTVFVVSTTNAAVPGTWFTTNGTAYVYVYAGNGPSPAQGSSAPGNVTGDAKGYWVGLNSVEKDITVGTGFRQTGVRLIRDRQAPLRRLMESYTVQ